MDTLQCCAGLHSLADFGVGFGPGVGFGRGFGVGFGAGLGVGLPDSVQVVMDAPAFALGKHLP